MTTRRPVPMPAVSSAQSRMHVERKAERTVEREAERKASKLLLNRAAMLFNQDAPGCI
jgi:hypothetical protein